ncbi:MAG: hypothetical protein MRY83_02095 [Flavobacteriales bacterium]|nr:hypothetical protein [Flavobacteriales bacterium]
MINWFKSSVQTVNWFIILCLIFSACKRDETIIPDFGYDYFPLTQGSWIIYDCDSVIYGLDVFTKTFQIREEVDTTFLDQEGKEAYRIVRSRRESATDNWTIQDVWLAYKDELFAERVEENKRIVKLAFPLKSNKTWDGNAKNAMESMEFEIDSIDFSFQTSSAFTSDSTLTVTQLLNQNIIQKFHKYEVYGKHIGLIYLRNDSLEFQTLNGSGDTTGVSFKMEMNSFFINE